MYIFLLFQYISIFIFLVRKSRFLIHFLPFTTKTSQKSSSNKGEKRERCVGPPEISIFSKGLSHEG